MAWRTTFIKHFGPGGLSGTTFGDWLKILRDNRYSVDARYWPRAALITYNCFMKLSTLLFPRNSDIYHKFLTLRDITPEELDAWKSTLLRFLRKLTFKYNRPLILKSPAHAGRIKVLLELFPEAKFVHIHRDPYAVYRSTIHAWPKIMPWWRLQECERDDGRVIRDYVEVYDAFFAQRHLIPEQNFCEVAYSDLACDPVGQMKQIYDSLNLPEFGYVEPTLREYVQSIADYSKNTFSDLPEPTRQRIAHEWDRCFEAWGYPK